MAAPSSRRTPPAAFSYAPLLALALFASTAAAGSLSGTWKRIDGGRDPADGLAGEGAGLEVPLAALQDDTRLVLGDEGTKLSVAYPSGRRRLFVTDGNEREQDDGDGPAKVTATRKGDRILVASKWSSGRGTKETWELSEGPRRLVVTTKVSGRRSFSFRRVYEPAPPGEPVPTPRATPRPTAVAAGTVEAAPVPPPAGMSACSIRPPRGTKGAALAGLAKVTSAQAEARALASAAPRKVDSVISSGPEVAEGCLVFTYDLRIAGEKGLLEVLVDAGDGKVLEAGAAEE